ncbi:uncharacterized protein PFL1_06167 [Pseudozyma flocculosa PF-1]|uniref:Prephenate dehydratase domain-containing protein n=2 Tax=Pseudozyma flocculosa TaxID=84751 RepID=A0A5C3F9X0_9BASI|nr:uncharacterized protein PFL1_06167 [Pseudozyma flocculosa PF-1]EPQ26232.1 hypothetical protein PFL1_06167 [Pseudozyma flocculosa PF-1]SPO40191.1 uncharacterized protein PSFLO_05673 [Pseudozyma flocculosa]
MASFFAKARERAEAAAQQFQAAHSSSSSSSNNNSTAAANASSSNPAGGDAHRSNFSYSGVVPHLLRQGIASVDPRYESNRPLHLLSGSIKSFNIDHDALAREAKAVAKATYNWGQNHLPENREDGVGDDMIADVTDRLAFLFHQLGQLEAAHCDRAEQARSSLKKFQKDEMELAARRDKRIKLKRELHALMPQQAVASSNNRSAELHRQLDELNHEDQADEEFLSRKKREGLQQGYTALFDSLIELGEKTALVARYGKVLTGLIPTEKSSFPAQVKPRGPEIPLWEGATKTAEIRAALQPALQAYKPIDTLPVIPSSASSGLGRADTVSYGVSNRADLEQDDAGTNSSARRNSGQHRRTSSASEHGRPTDPFASPHDSAAAAAAPSSSPQSHLNMSPSTIPAPTGLPRRVPPLPGSSSAGTAGVGNSPLPPNATPPAAPDPSRSPSATFAALGSGPGASSASVGGAHDEGAAGGNVPPAPTVAETGVVPQGTGGPKSGTLLPRRSSSLTRSKSISAGAVAYLGPAGTYTYQAAVKVFGKEGASLIPMQSISSAVDFVKRGSPGNVKFAVVPFENSTFGPVKDTVDGLCDLANHSGGGHNSGGGVTGKAYIIGETSLDIQHALLCGPKTYHHLLQLQGSRDNLDAIRPDTLAHITQVFSHEQALGQCARFLERCMPSARKKQVDSTAGAATAALEVENCTAPGLATGAIYSPHESPGASGSCPLVAAIGPESCAEEVGVRVLKTSIQDTDNNRTRFVVLASEPLDMVTRSAILPGQLQSHLNESLRGVVRSRSMVRVFDAMNADDGGAAGADGALIGSPSKFQQFLAEVSVDQQTRLRKIERRPAPFVGGVGPSAAGETAQNVWKGAYLVELEVDGQHAEEARQRFESIVARLGGSSAGGPYFDRGIDYLGSWNTNSLSSVSGESTSASAAGMARPATPPRPLGGNPFGPSASSSSGISDLATPGHAVRRPSGTGLVASGSTSSVSTDATVHAAQQPELSEREKKEQEAQREADEVRRHAAQARFSRQQQQQSLYGGAPEQGGRLEGLQENKEAEGDENDEDLPAYEPFSRPGQ